MTSEIREAHQINFLLSYAMLQGGLLGDAVKVLTCMLGADVDQKVIDIATEIMRQRIMGMPEAIMFGRPQRKVKMIMKISAVRQGDVVDGRQVVGKHTRFAGLGLPPQTRLLFEIPGVQSDDSPESAWTRWIDSDVYITAYC